MNRAGQVVAQITKWIGRWSADKKTGKLVFEINFRNGGIGKSNIRTEESFENNT